MKANDTELMNWTCPDCGGKQEEIVVKGMSLPPYLECPDCGHKSDLIKWGQNYD